MTLADTSPASLGGVLEAQNRLFCRHCSLAEAMFQEAGQDQAILAVFIPDSNLVALQAAMC